MSTSPPPSVSVPTGGQLLGGTRGIVFGRHRRGRGWREQRRVAEGRIRPGPRHRGRRSEGGSSGRRGACASVACGHVAFAATAVGQSWIVLPWGGAGPGPPLGSPSPPPLAMVAGQAPGQHSVAEGGSGTSPTAATAVGLMAVRAASCCRRAGTASESLSVVGGRWRLEQRRGADGRVRDALTIAATAGYGGERSCTGAESSILRPMPHLRHRRRQRGADGRAEDPVLACTAPAGLCVC